MTLHQKQILSRMHDGLLLKRDSVGFPFFEKDGERVNMFLDGRTIASLSRRGWIRFWYGERQYELTESGRKAVEEACR